MKLHRIKTKFTVESNVLIEAETREEALADVQSVVPELWKDNLGKWRVKIGIEKDNETN